MTNGCTREVTDGCTMKVTDGCTREVTDSCTRKVTDGCTRKVTDGCTRKVTAAPVGGTGGMGAKHSWGAGLLGRRSRVAGGWLGGTRAAREIFSGHSLQVGGGGRTANGEADV